MGQSSANELRWMGRDQSRAGALRPQRRPPRSSSPAAPRMHPVQTFEIAQTQYKVADFLEWQRVGNLDLSPEFQRRTVWKPGAKSFLIDTVSRGLPTPIIFLRDRIDLSAMKPTREVVDGQQRLRTLLSFIDPKSLGNKWDPERDDFTVQKNHNAELAGKKFSELDPSIQRQLLDYSFSTHVLPSSVEDRDVLRIFQRMNSTGEKLKPQELRNAEFFGEFKTTMYELALEQLERWRNWGVFTGDEIARMKEVELTSDLAVIMLDGYGAKSQAKITKFYEEYNDAFPKVRRLSQRFRAMMDAIDELLGPELKKTVFSREIWFVVLAYFVYRELYDGRDLSVNFKRRRLPKNLTSRLLKVSEQIRSGADIPPDVLDAIRGASSDQKSRSARLRFVEENL